MTHFYAMLIFIFTICLATAEGSTAGLRLGIYDHDSPNTATDRPTAFIQFSANLLPYSLSAFELSAMGYSNEKWHFQAKSLEVTYNGLGIHLPSWSGAAIAGVQVPLSKYGIDDLSYAIRKYVFGAYGYWNHGQLTGKITYKEYQAAQRSKQKIDSFEVEFVPDNYNVLTSELRYDLAPLDFGLTVGRYSRLSGVYHLVAFSAPIRHRSVTFYQAEIGFFLESGQKLIISYNDSLNSVQSGIFYPIIGSQVNQQVTRSGAVGFEIQF